MVQASEIALVLEEVEVSWNCEAGAIVCKVYIAMYGTSFEIWVGVNGNYRDRVGGALEVSRYPYNGTKVTLMYGEERL